MLPRLIVFDGPTAAGKSAAGFRLSQDLGYQFFDTGLLFRVTCWKALQTGDGPYAEALCARIAAALELELLPPEPDEARAGRTSTVKVDGQDITWELRQPRVDRLLPAVSAMAGVREALTERMRRIGTAYQAGQGLAQGVVVVGRDVGTVVFPDARCKFFLTAQPSVRARRRYAELKAQGASVQLQAVLADLQERDRIDSTRRLAPTKAASDAIILDTTDLSLDATLTALHSRLRERFSAP